jgi:hypothetical protein
MCLVQGWGRNLVASNNRGDTQQNTADDLAECAPQFRLEALEPRLLLSADPISAELARVVQQDAEDNNAEAVAAIVQEIESIAESNAAEHSGSGHNEFKVEWPEGWNTGASVESSQIDLLLVVTDLVNQARQSLPQGVDSSDLVIGIKADGEGTTAPGDDAENPINQALLGKTLDQVSDDFSESNLADWLAELSIELADLEGDLLAELRGDTLFIDIDAAGHGWYIDPTLLPQTTQPEASDDSAKADFISSFTAVQPAFNSSINAADRHDSAGENEASVAAATDPETYPIVPPGSHNSSAMAEQEAAETDTDQGQKSLLPANFSDSQSSTGDDDNQVSEPTDDLLQPALELQSDTLWLMVKTVQNLLSAMSQLHFACRKTTVPAAMNLIDQQVNKTKIETAMMLGSHQITRVILLPR